MGFFSALRVPRFTVISWVDINKIFSEEPSTLATGKSHGPPHTHTDSCNLKRKLFQDKKIKINFHDLIFGNLYLTFVQALICFLPCPCEFT